MNTQALYETDFNSWIQENITLLKESRLNEIDSQNLIEELEDLIRRDKRELESYLFVLIAYLLKWQYQNVYRCNEWLCKIIEQRFFIRFLFENMPSLKSYLPTAVENIYSHAVKLATVESGTESFPSVCPYSEQQLLDEDFLSLSYQATSRYKKYLQCNRLIIKPKIPEQIWQKKKIITNCSKWIETPAMRKSKKAINAWR